MKHITIVFSILCLAGSIKFGADKQDTISTIQTSSQTQIKTSFEALKKTELGKLFVDFAQLETEVSGSVDVLIDVMKAFGRQIESKLKAEQEQFDAIQGDHVSKVLQLESMVNQAEIDINRDKKRLNQELIPRSSDLDDVLLSLKAKKQNNGDSVISAKMTRKDQNAAFNMQANEISEAIRSVDEALQTIKIFQDEASTQSLIEVSQQQKGTIVQKIHIIKNKADKVGKMYGSFLTALSDLSEGQNFADRQVLKQLVDLLNSLRGNFVETLQKAYADEDQLKLLHEKRMDQLQKEFLVFDQQYGEALQEREEKTLMIDDTNNIIAVRNIEHQGYSKRLQTENNIFAMNQKIHDDLTVRTPHKIQSLLQQAINLEIGDIEKALDLLQSPAMADYLQTAINKAK